MNIRTVKTRGALLAATTALGVGSLLAPTATAASTSDAGTAQAKCRVTAWGHQGYYMCGSNLRAGRVDWNGDGHVDEVFVIAPNRTIWHTWASAGGWKEMPGNGRADWMEGPMETGSGIQRRCIVVQEKQSGNYPYWQNCHYNGRWHKWTTAG